jgi:hypothetical protein
MTFTNDTKEHTGEIAPFKLDSKLRYRVVGIGERYHWLDRKTNQPLTYKNGDEAQFDSLDEAIDAFLSGRLSAEQNEELR